WVCRRGRLAPRSTGLSAPGGRPDKKPPPIRSSAWSNGTPSPCPCSLSPWSSSWRSSSVGSVSTAKCSTFPRALQRDRGRRVTTLQRRVGLPYPVPLFADDRRVDRAVGMAHQAGQRPVVAPHVEAVEALLLDAADARAEPPPQHGERGEVDLRVAVGVGVVLLELQVALVVAEPVEHER